MSASGFVNTELQEALESRHVRSTYLHDRGGMCSHEITVGGRGVRIGLCGSAIGSSPHSFFGRGKDGYVLCVETKEKSMKKVIEILENKFNETSVLEKLFWKCEGITKFRIHLNIGMERDDNDDGYNGKMEQKATFYIYSCSEDQWFVHCMNFFSFDY